LHTLATDGELSVIYFRGIRDLDSIKDAERVRLSSALGYLFGVIEEAYFFWKEDNLDPEFWYGFETSVKGILAYRGVQDCWSTRCHWYNEPFRKYVQSLMLASGPAKMYGEVVDA